jgi:NAD(P)-dependent dehydrogenase (short-subunit alcohol dehydrogenase family)
MAEAALVTGGSSGIGLAIARMLRHRGYDVTVSARTQDRLDAAAQELGAYAVQANVAQAEDCERLVAEHRKRFERLDVLVNCAGVGIGRSIAELEPKHWDLQFAVNVRGAFVVTREALPLLREARGWIVNVSSIAGTIAAPGLAAYGASKAAMISLTKSLNAELETAGVRACAICPGFVDTRMAAWTGMESAEMIQPNDCAEVVGMLLSLSPRALVPQVVIERLGS